MMRDLEEEKVFNEEMAKRIAEMEQQNDYLQRKLSENLKDFKSKDDEIDKLQLQLKALRCDNQELKKSIDNYREQHESTAQHRLIEECMKNSKNRQRDQQQQLDRSDLIYQRRNNQSDQQIEHRLKSRIFEASRRAAETYNQHQRSLSGGERKGLHHSFEGRKSIRAELDSLKNAGKLRLPRQHFNIEDARRVLRENSIGSNTRNNVVQMRSTSQNIMSTTNSEQLLFTGTLQQHLNFGIGTGTTQQQQQQRYNNNQSPELPQLSQETPAYNLVAENLSTALQVVESNDGDQNDSNYQNDNHQTNTNIQVYSDNDREFVSFDERQQNHLKHDEPSLERILERRGELLSSIDKVNDEDKSYDEGEEKDHKVNYRVQKMMAEMSDIK